MADIEGRTNSKVRWRMLAGLNRAGDIAGGGSKAAHPYENDAVKLKGSEDRKRGTGVGIRSGSGSNDRSPTEAGRQGSGLGSPRHFPLKRSKLIRFEKKRCGKVGDDYAKYAGTQRTNLREKL